LKIRSIMQYITLKNPEGMSLQATHWPVEKPRAVLALVHGQGEHVGRYPHLAAWYNQRGIAVVGIDLQGHGKSEGARGHAKALDSLLNDIGTLLNEVKRLYPGVTTFLYGHSMGGNLCLNYTIRRKPAIKGLIVTGPWIRLAFEAPAVKIIVGKLLRKFMPTLSLPTGLTARFLSHDENVVNGYMNDPLVHDKLSASEGIFMMEAADFLNKYEGAMPVPTLIMHGDDDRLTSAPASREFAKRAKGDITHHTWPDLYHEIHNEASQEEVFALTLGWLEGKI
jgi:alpha-beta hydrolase superfamily lysophospholipase